MTQFFVHSLNGYISQFIITTPDGTKFYFSEKELSFSDPRQYIDNLITTDCEPAILNPYETYFTSPAGYNCLPQYYHEATDNNTIAYKDLDLYYSSWHLSKVVSPKGTTVYFEYDDYIMYDHSQVSQQSAFLPAFDDTPGCKDQQYSRSYFVTSAGKRLSQISWNGTQSSPVAKMNFLASTVREDLYYPPSFPQNSKAKSLDLITISSGSGEVRKEFKLDYDYHNEKLLNCNEMPLSEWMIAHRKRLRLKSVTEQNGSDESLPPYTFEYNETPLPPRHSPNIDYWGYYNGAENESFLTGRRFYWADNDSLDNNNLESLYDPMRTLGGDVTTVFDPVNNIGHPNADRTPDINGNSTQAGILKTINFPTGGSTSYEYELNQFKVERINQTNPPLPTVFKGDGLRVKRISTSDGESGSNHFVRDIIYPVEYGPAGPIDCVGRLIDMPRLARLHYSTSNIYDASSHTIFSSHSETGNGGDGVVYEKVIVTYPEKGRIEYTYDAPAFLGDSDFPIGCSFSCIYERSNTEQAQYQIANSSINQHANEKFPYAPNPNFNWARGQLLEMHIFNEQGEEQKSVINQYAIRDFTKINGVKSYLVSDYVLITYPNEGTYENVIEEIGVLVGKYYHISGFKHITRQVTRDYLNGGYVETISNYKFEGDHPFPTEVSIMNSDGKVHKTEFYYTEEMQGAGTYVQEMSDRHMIGIPLKQLKYVDDIVVGGALTTYDDFNDKMLPHQTYIRAQQASELWILEGTYSSYFDDGYPQIFDEPDFPPVSFTWLYGNMTSRSQEVSPGISFTELYTYDPVTNQVLSATDINGITTEYTYDALLRPDTIFSRNGTIKTINSYQIGGAGGNNWASTFTDFGDSQANNTETQEATTFYDGLGRTKKQVAFGHTPGGADLTTQIVSYNKEGKVFVESNPVSGLTWYNYDSSPLQRLILTNPSGPGYISYQYKTNVGPIIIAPNSAYATTYLPGQLYGQSVTDENGNTTNVFSNKIGQRVAMQNAEGNWTYYLYDDYSQLIYVLPPDANDITHPAIYRYTYDFKGRLTRKYLPDSEYLEYQYNNRDELVYSQNGNQRANNQWIQIEYDNIGRTVKTSLYNGSPPNGGLVQVLTQTKYDTGTDNTTNGASYGQVTWTSTAMLDAPGPNLESEIEYDEFGRPLQIAADNYIGGQDIVTTEYDNADKVWSVNRQHNGTLIRNRNTYDHAGRAQRTFHQIGGSVGAEREISFFQYFENGLLKEKNLGHNLFNPAQPYLQSVDYQYNVRGWLTDINKVPEVSSGLAIPDCGTVNTVPCTTTNEIPCPKPDIETKSLTLGEVLGLRLLGDDLKLGCKSDCDSTSASTTTCDYTVSFEISQFDQVDSIFAGGQLIPLSGYPYLSSANYSSLENDLYSWLLTNGYAVDSVSRAYQVRDIIFTIHQTNISFDNLFGFDDFYGRIHQSGFVSSNCNTSAEVRCTYGINQPASNVHSTAIFSRHYREPAYANLIAMNDGSDQSLQIDNALWHVSNTDFPKWAKGEVAWDVDFDVSDFDPSSIQSYEIAVEVSDILLTSGSVQLALYDGANLVAVNGNQLILNVNDNGLWLLKPDQIPTAAQLESMQVAMLFEEGRYIDIDGVSLQIKYEKDCGDSTPCNPDMNESCNGEDETTQNEALLRLQEKMYTTRVEEIEYPTTLNRVKLCDSSEWYVLEQELWFYQGNYTVTQSIEILTDNVLIGQDIPIESNDLFSEEIHYWEANTDLNAAAQYNGNISWVKWKVAGQTNKGYGYTYDAMNRLKNAHFAEFFSDGGDCSVSTNGRYDVRNINYDARGNITTLSRNGVTGGSCNQGYDFGLIDHLAYEYYDHTSGSLNGNRLKNVKDFAYSEKGFDDLSVSVDYQYDANGNLTQDRNKDISAGQISYNIFNLPSSVVKDNGDRIDWTYDAAGNLLKMTTIVGNDYISRVYQGGVEYIESGTLGNPGSLEIESIMHAGGRAVKQSNNSYLYEYVLTDHLGNVRLRFADLDFDGKIDLPDDNSAYTEVFQEMHYYPFGMKQEGPWVPISGQPFRYQYNGIEYLEELGLNVNFALFRTLDSSIGRWWQVDPKAESFYQWSPFNSMENNPITHVDPDGDNPFVVAAVIGGGLNLWSNWDKVDGFWNGLQYFGTGAMAGSATIVNPLAGAAILGLGNTWADNTNGTLQAVAEEGGAAVVNYILNRAIEVAFEYIGGRFFQNVSGGIGHYMRADVEHGAVAQIPEMVVTGVEVKAKDVVKDVVEEAAKTSTTTVGRWMSKAEYEIMKKTGRMVEGAGGKTSVSVGDSNAFTGASKGSVYVEFQVPSSSLIQGGQSNWFSILGPNASKSQLHMLQKQGGQLLPKVENLSPILKVK